MENQIVRSYVRNVGSTRQEPNETGNHIGFITLAAIAVLLWQITIPALLLLGAAYGVTALVRQPSPTKTAEAVTSPENVPQTKRHYQHRLKVTMYDTGKTIRV